jgi:putative FmdB family regulatory protein
MPIYEYTCSKCKDNFEHLARSLDDHPGKCPACGSRKVSKQFSAFATTKTFQMASGQASCPKAPACPAAGSCASGCCGGE